MADDQNSAVSRQGSSPLARSARATYAGESAPSDNEQSVPGIRSARATISQDGGFSSPLARSALSGGASAPADDIPLLARAASGLAQGATLSPIREETGRLSAATPLTRSGSGLSQRSVGVKTPEMLESTTALDIGALGLDVGSDRRESTIGAVHQLLDRVRRASAVSTSSPLNVLDPRRASMAQQVIRQQSVMTVDGQSAIMFTPPEGYGPRHSSFVFTMDGAGQLLQDVVRLSGDTADNGAIADKADEAQEVYDYPGMDITLDILHADTEELKKLFIMKLASVLASYGCPTHRMDYNMHQVSEAMGLCSSFFSLPPTTMISFQHQREGKFRTSADTYIVRSPRGYNLEKLARVDALCDKIVNHEQFTMLDAIHELNVIIQDPLLYNFYVRATTMFVCSATCGLLFFRLPWESILLAGALGLMLEIFDVFLFANSKSARLIFEVFCAMMCGFVAKAIASATDRICANGTAIAAIIWLVPGLELTLAFYEFSTRYIASGSTRFLWAMISYIMFAFGLGTGAELVIWWDGNNTVNVDERCNYAHEWYTQVPALVVMCLSFALLFQGAIHHLPAMTITGCIVYCVQNAALLAFPYGTSTVMAAFVLGLCGNVFAKYSRRPASIVIISGVLVLVPGGMGVKAMQSMFYDTTSGVGIGSALQTVIAIAVGILFSNQVLPPVRMIGKHDLKDLSF